MILAGIGWRKMMRLGEGLTRAKCCHFAETLQFSEKHEPRHHKIAIAAVILGLVLALLPPAQRATAVKVALGGGCADRARCGYAHAERQPSYHRRHDQRAGADHRASAVLPMGRALLVPFTRVSTSTLCVFLSMLV